MKLTWKLMIVIAILFLSLGYLLDRKFGKHPTRYLTRYIQKPIYKERIIKGDTLPPRVVISYKTLPPHTKYKDSIRDHYIYLYDTSGNNLPINKDFLHYKPGVPKLIHGSFTKSSISLDLLDTSGKLYTKSWILDYEKHDYFWDGYALNTADKPIHIEGIPKNNPFKTESYLYLTKDIWDTKVYMSLDYSLMYKSIGLYSQGYLGYNYKTLNLSPTVLLGLRLKLR